MKAMAHYFPAHIAVVRFDGIKYDIKKIEEVVYDITLRGLQKSDDDDENASKKLKVDH